MAKRQRRIEDRTRNRQILTDQGRFPGGPESDRRLRELGLVNPRSFPRNEEAYKKIQETFPDFGWTIYDYGKQRAVKFKNYPLVDGKTPSLADLVEEALRQPGEKQKIKVDDLPPSVRKKTDMLVAGTKTGTEFVKLLAELPAIFPPRKVIYALREWLLNLEGGEPSTIFCTVCPDYETRETGDPKRPVEYTFNGLGSGIGLVAQRALYAFTKIWGFCLEQNLTNLKFVIAMADSEAYEPANLERVGLETREFIERLRESQRAFKSSCPKDMPISTPMLTKINPKLWKQKLKDAEQAVFNGYYGVLVDEHDLKTICAARKSLYERWFGPLTNEQLIDALKKQIPEYMVPGIIAEANYPNPLIIGTDSVTMAPFLQGLVENPIPVIYLRSLNY